MTKNRKNHLFLTILFFFILLSLIAFVGGTYLINSIVVGKFGHPTSSLTFTQRILYPIELFIHRNTLTTPNSTSDQEQAFAISQGESVSMICIRLEQAGLIEDAELLRTYLVYSGLDRQLQSGQFSLSQNMSPMQIGLNLLDATPSEAIISILPGWRIEEVAENVAGSGLAISKETFVSGAFSPSYEWISYLPVSDLPILEGFLFPGIYVISRDADLNSLFEKILTEFSSNIDEELIAGFERQGLSIYEAVTLASIIEKEAVVDDEKPLIASVFLNRLAQGMRLETDPTVQYALGYQEEIPTWWKSPLLSEDLAIESPYNTYLIYGLPPTPICNPDLGSLRAVAFPAETPYLYFRAACDGSGRHNFAITFEEHLNNACE